MPRPSSQATALPMATDHTVSQEEEVIQIESEVPRDVDVETASQAGNEAEQTQDKRGGKKEGAAQRDREPGKSVLPFSRVQRIMKADKELPMVARDATFLVSLATEEFIKRLSQACQRVAEREKRTTVQQRDVASVVRRVDEFLFLEEIIGSQESTGRRQLLKARSNAAGAPSDQDQAQPTLRSFIQKDNEAGDAAETTDIAMDEDGAMYAG